MQYDIVIVGAGPAGCTLARELHGFKVLLIEQGKIPRDKPCGGVLIEESIDFIKRLKPPDNIFSKPNELKLRYIDMDLKEEVIQNKKWWNIDRRAFDFWLWNTIDDNTEKITETKLLGFEEKENLINIYINTKGKNQTIQSRYLVGADGPNSFIRTKLKQDGIKRYLAVQKWLRSEMNLNEFIYLLNNEITDYYSWIIPKRDSVILGSALPIRSDANNALNHLEKIAKENFDISGTLTKTEAFTVLRPSSLDNIILGKDRIFLIGEASGLINPFTGEGISFALRSGYNLSKAFNYDDVLQSYKNISSKLLTEMEDKIKKAGLLATLDSRKKLIAYLRNQ